MKAKRVLLIGWDAADWKVIDQLMARGHMPTLQSMVKNGVRGNLSTLQPVLSPMLWSSIATGKFADKHGIHGFTEPDYEGGSIRPISSRSRKARAIWNILTHQGKKSNVFSWWPSNPAEPINGIMVSNLYQRANKPLADGWPMLPGTVHPDDKERLFKRCRVHPDELTSAHILPFVPNAGKIDQKNDKRIGALSKMIADAASVHAASTWAMENSEWDFTAIYHDAIDHSCHGFMKFREPRMPGVPEDLFQNYKDVVDGMYRFHDMMLERCLQLAGPDTNVILISDHGFQSDHLRPLSLPQEPAAPAAEHRQHGIICCYGPDFKKGHTIYGSSILDITPTLLTLFGLPVGKDMDGTPLLQAFEEVPTVKSIDSWEKVEGHFGEHDRDHKVNPEDAKAALKQLVELGYIEDPGEDVKKAMKNTAIELKYNLSKVYASTGRPKQALELLEEILTEKDEYRFRIRIAENLKRLERYDDALNMLDEIDRMLHEERKRTNKRLKEESSEEPKAEEDDDKKDKVKSELAHLKKQKAETKKRFMSVQLLMADIYKSQKVFEKAIEVLQQLSERAPNSISVLKSTADCLIKMEKWKDARNAYISILNIDPHDHGAHRGLAFCNNKLGKYEEAVESALTATELVYQYPAAHFILGDSLYHLGQDEYAAKTLEVALAMRPAYTAPRILLDKMAKEGRYVPSDARELTIEEMDSGSINQQLVVQADKNAGVKTYTGTKHGEITVVSGLPRSGTSLMMQMLHAGGMEIFTDEVREADENNPKGFYEHEKVKRLASSNVWIKEAQGKVLKVVSQLTKFLPPNHDYKAVVMKRDIGEVTLSQHKMLVRLGKAKQSDSYPLRLEKTLRAQYDGAKKWMEAQDHVSFIEVDYHDTLNNPAAVAKEISTFLGKDLDIDAMIAQVDKDLYRSKTKK